EYNKKFAFIVHDIKNLASQLGMLVPNNRRYSDNPEFRADMVRTLENSVARLNALLARLSSERPGTRQPEFVDPVTVIKDVMACRAHHERPIELEAPEAPVRMGIGFDELHSVLTHLLTNAIEASHPGDRVRVRLSSNNGRVVLDVEDDGSGMDSAFIRN